MWKEHAEPLGRAFRQQFAILDPDAIAGELQAGALGSLSEDRKVALSLSGECLLSDNSEAAGYRPAGLKLRDTGMLPLEPLAGWAGSFRR